MALEEDLRRIFHREIEAQLGKLERKFAAATSPDGATDEGPPPERLGEFRRMARQMTENVLQRVAEKAPEWEDSREDCAEGGTQAAPGGAAAARVERGAERSRLRARCRGLEAELQAKRAEAAQTHEQLFARCAADFATALNAREQELHEAQQQALARGPDPQEARADEAHAAELRSQFSEHMQAIKERLAATKQAVVDLDSKKKGLERIEALQQCGLLPIEELLAGGAIDGHGDDADEALLGAIRRGEQVCKRMRRHISAGA